MPKQVPPVPHGPKALGPYSVATEAAGLVFVSGQVAVDPQTSERVTDGVIPQTRRVMDNIGVILKDLGLGYEDIVKTSIFLADIAAFPQVNEVYATYFSGDPPARSTFQPGALPGGFLVEIEVVAAR